MLFRACRPFSRLQNRCAGPFRDTLPGNACNASMSGCLRGNMAWGRRCGHVKRCPRMSRHRISVRRTGSAVRMVHTAVGSPAAYLAVRVNEVASMQVVLRALPAGLALAIIEGKAERAALHRVRSRLIRRTRCFCATVATTGALRPGALVASGAAASGWLRGGA